MGACKKKQTALRISVTSDLTCDTVLVTTAEKDELCQKQGWAGKGSAGSWRSNSIQFQCRHGDDPGDRAEPWYLPGTVVKLAFLSAATEAGTCPTVRSTIPSGLQISSAEKSTHPHHLPPKILRLLIHCRASSRIFHCGAHGIPGVCPPLMLLELITPALTCHKNHWLLAAALCFSSS